MSDYSLARITELSTRIEFLEAVACESGHRWVKASDLSNGAERQVCSRCGKTQVIEPAVEPEASTDIIRSYFLDALVYEALQEFDKETLTAAADGLIGASHVAESFWDEYPEAGLTEGELHNVFKQAIDQMD